MWSGDGVEKGGCRAGRVCVRGGVEMRCKIDGTKRRGCVRGVVLRGEDV